MSAVRAARTIVLVVSRLRLRRPCARETTAFSLRSTTVSRASHPATHKSRAQECRSGQPAEGDQQPAPSQGVVRRKYETRSRRALDWPAGIDSRVNMVCLSMCYVRIACIPDAVPLHAAADALVPSSCAASIALIPPQPPQLAHTAAQAPPTSAPRLHPPTLARAYCRIRTSESTSSEGASTQVSLLLLMTSRELRLISAAPTAQPKERDEAKSLGAPSSIQHS